MKNFLVLSVILFSFSCTKNTPTTLIDIQAEIIDLSFTGIVGTWELIDSGPLSCPGDHYTFRQDGIYDISYSFDCNQPLPLFTELPNNKMWRGNEENFTFPYIESILSGTTYTIISKDENSMQTSTPKAGYLEYQNWRKVN